MPTIICGHWNFVVRDVWLLCQDCERGININSEKGKRLLRIKSKSILLDKQQKEVHQALIDSYKEYKANEIKNNDD